MPLEVLGGVQALDRPAGDRREGCGALGRLLERRLERVVLPALLPGFRNRFHTNDIIGAYPIRRLSPTTRSRRFAKTARRESACGTQNRICTSAVRNCIDMCAQPSGNLGDPLHGNGCAVVISCCLLSSNGRAWHPRTSERSGRCLFLPHDRSPTLRHFAERLARRFQRRRAHRPRRQRGAAEPRRRGPRDRPASATAAASFTATHVTSYVGHVLGVGDFNGDRRTDLIVADGGSANVAILPGNGNGTFAAPRRSHRRPST